jgi:hypothetical protein
VGIFILVMMEDAKGLMSEQKKKKDWHMIEYGR